MNNERWSHAQNWLLENRVRVLLLFCGVLLPLVVFGAVAEDVRDRENLRFDDPLLLWAHSYESSWWNSFMLAWTRLGTPLVMVALCALIAFFLLLKQRRGDAVFFLVCVVGASLLNVVAKAFFGRTRPDLWVSIDPRSDYSFPSGHAMGTMALCASLCVLCWHTPHRWTALTISFVVVLCVGASRVYLGVHFPSDVLCGWLASLSWVIGLHLIRRMRPRQMQ